MSAQRQRYAAQQSGAYRAHAAADGGGQQDGEPGQREADVDDADGHPSRAAEQYRAQNDGAEQIVHVQARATLLRHLNRVADRGRAKHARQQGHGAENQGFLRGRRDDQREQPQG